MFRDLEYATKSQFLNLEKEALLYQMEKSTSQDDVTPLGLKRRVTNASAPNKFCFLSLNKRYSDLLLYSVNGNCYIYIQIFVLEDR